MQRGFARVILLFVEYTVEHVFQFTVVNGFEQEVEGVKTE